MVGMTKLSFTIMKARPNGGLINCLHNVASKRADAYKMSSVHLLIGVPEIGNRPPLPLSFQKLRSNRYLKKGTT